MSNSFPPSATEFYALRDDRTNRCTSLRRYQYATCILYLSPSLAEDKTAQVIFLAAANLLSRWCRYVTLVAPQVALHPNLDSKSDSLVEAALHQMRDADPFGSFDAQRSIPHCKHDIALCVVDDIPKLPVVHAVFVNAEGWLASVSLKEPFSISPTENENCVGAIAAACFGMAQVFKMALGLSADRLLRDGVFDVFELDWTKVPNVGPSLQTDIGRLLMVGAGSVGSSVAYCMRMAGVTGEITILDKDVVKIENFNRSPIFSRQAIGLNKSEVTAKHLAKSALQAIAHPVWWNDYIEKQDRLTLQFDVWLPLANDHGVRFSMQNNVPPVMIHASTTANWGVNHGRHLPSTDDCLVDRFPNQVSTDAFVCATGEIIEQDEQIDAALPFCSLFAGLLVTAELLRLQLPNYPQVPNFALIDWYATLETIQKWNNAPRSTCICRQQGRYFHEKFNKTTRHWSKFRF